MQIHWTKPSQDKLIFESIASEAVSRGQCSEEFLCSATGQQAVRTRMEDVSVYLEKADSEQCWVGRTSFYKQVCSGECMNSVFSVEFLQFGFFTELKLFASYFLVYKT